MQNKVKEFIVNYISTNYHADVKEIEREPLKRFIDSLDALEMLMCIEKEFNISIEDELSQEWKTLDDVIRDVMVLIDQK